jgi:hypothetical protein
LNGERARRHWSDGVMECWVVNGKAYLDEQILWA